MLKHHLIRRTLTGGLVIVAVGFPATAQARTCQRPVQLPNTPYSNRALPQCSASDVSVQHRSQAGFQWGDAGIGAAGAAVLLGGAAAGVGMTRRRRIPRTAG
jgi:hypothetical protein